jgi:hypothetical protein
MSQCQCQGIESTFDRREAALQLEKARRKGPRRTTRVLLAALRENGVAGRTLLDIGGGVVVIQHELLESGLSEATSVDASSAYLETARAEARRLGYEGRVRYHHGNFVDLAPGIEQADVVTLDRVICCYDDVVALVSASCAKARRVYGLVYPRATRWARIAVGFFNWIRRVRGSPFRVFIHPDETVDNAARAQGLRRSFARGAGMWQVVLYTR